jgi:DNA-binding HxlR family transcriptional regulator
MYDYNEACPISMAASVICERWTLQIIRELFFGSTRYSEIQKHIPNISPSLLRNRLRFLEEQDLILRKRAAGANRMEYHLTPSGKALAPVLAEMGKWGMCWARDEESPTRYIHVQNGVTQVCDTDLGFEVDVYIKSTLKIMTSIWYGETDMCSAIEDGRMNVVAAPVYTRRITRWLGISSFTTDHPSIASS